MTSNIICAFIACNSLMTGEIRLGPLALQNLRISSLQVSSPWATLEYKEGRGHFIFRSRSGRNRNKRTAKRRLRIMPGPVVRLNFARAAALCEFSGGRLPTLAEASGLFSKDGEKPTAGRSIWTATPYHHSPRAAWVFHTRTGVSRGALNYRRAGVVCISRH